MQLVFEALAAAAATAESPHLADCPENALMSIARDARAALQQCEQRAREILGGTIKPENVLHEEGAYTHWSPKRAEVITLDGDFNADDLEAMAWWMRNKAQQ